MIRFLDFNDGYITPKGGGHPSDTLAASFQRPKSRERAAAISFSRPFLPMRPSAKLPTFSTPEDWASINRPCSTRQPHCASRVDGLTKEQLVHAIGITIGGNTAMNQAASGPCPTGRTLPRPEILAQAIFSAQLAQPA